MILIRRSQTLILTAAISLILLTFLSWNDSNYVSYLSPTTRLKQEEAIRAIDQRYCGGPCKFLLPVFIVEQESKAQMHFRQLAFTAGLINRTVVLPNVGNSRLGACTGHEFGFYYSHEWLDNNREHFKYITLQHFKAWLEERKAVGVKPTSQDITLQLEPTRRHFSDDQVNCWQPWLNMENYPPRHLDLADRESSSGLEIQNKIVSFLRGQPTEDEIKQSVRVSSDLDVLSVFYDRRFPFIQNPAAQTALSYSEQLTAVSRDMASSISPYLAIHWRTERIEPVHNLELCARSLVDKIQGIASTIPNVFLLTDYPHLLNTSIAQTQNGTSTSFRPSQISESHHAAMRYLYEHAHVMLTTFISSDEVPKDLPANWTLLHMPQVTNANGEVVIGDKGVLGIIDKLMAMQGQWFLAGQPGVCGRSSSFTNRIVAEREMLLDSNQASFGNVVDYFNLPEEAVMEH
ncbi:unnamed protein product [Umbelopsis ramanniana]